MARSHTAEPCSSSPATALLSLPDELLERVVTYTIPEGLESIAVTCQRIYSISIPFFEQHNALRKQFRHFAFQPYDFKNFDFAHMTGAWDLIARIAVRPIVARYIWHANFGRDSRSIFPRNWQYKLDDMPEEISELFANSNYLKEAGLDARDYHAMMLRDFNDPQYSQAAVVFLLTLLPNVETLKLPRKWLPNSASNKLLDVIVANAREPQKPLSLTPSLAQTRFIHNIQSAHPSCSYDLANACPFLSLPHATTYRGTSAFFTQQPASYDGIKPSRELYPSAFGENLVTIHLWTSCIDDAGISAFLKHTKQLRTLVYSHATKQHRFLQPHDWNLCKFITSIENAVADHLEELSISIAELSGSIAPGTASLRRFKQLRKLELPLELFACNIDASRTADKPIDLNRLSLEHQLKPRASRIGEVLPASVSELSLRSDGRVDHTDILREIFKDFTVDKADTLPALWHMQISCLNTADELYKSECERLGPEMQKVDVDLHLVPSLANSTLTWQGDG